MQIPSAAAGRGLGRPMERPYYQTLSFDDLEVLVLVENGGATPREVDDSLGMGLRETKAVFRDLVRRGLLDWDGRNPWLGALPMPWRFATTTFQLTPLARSLRADEAFSLKAFAASLLIPSKVCPYGPAHMQPPRTCRPNRSLSSVAMKL